jgi:hypothetical protein
MQPPLKITGTFIEEKNPTSGFKHTAESQHYYRPK